MALTSILITGDHNSRGFEVLVNGMAKWIPRSLFEYLLELVTQIWATKSGFLFTQDVLSTERDEERTRQVVHRLREELGDYHAIANGCKSYRLACDADNIAVDDSLFEVPSGILDPRVLGRLKEAAARHTASNVSRPQHGAVTQVVTKLHGSSTVLEGGDHEYRVERKHGHPEPVPDNKGHEGP